MERESYRSREQTYLKHLVVKKYLERLSYVIGVGWKAKVCFVDCFAGPWRTEMESNQDSSIRISLDTLKKVKSNLRKENFKVDFKAIYNEKNRESYNELKRIISDEKDIETVALHGEFEDNIDNILAETKGTFALFYIDPTGWTGFGLKCIEPIIKRSNSELLINFMYDFIQRFIDTNEQRENFNKLFGCEDWRREINLNSPDKESQLIEYYKQRLKILGDWKYVSNSKILYPDKDKTYFHLIYSTRNLKGLREYKKIDNEMLDEQRKVRERIKLKGQQSLFPEHKGKDDFYYTIYQDQRRALENYLPELLKNHKEISYEDILKHVLEWEMIFEEDVKELILNYLNEGKVEISEWHSRRRKPRDGDKVKWRTESHDRGDNNE